MLRHSQSNNFNFQSLQEPKKAKLDEPLPAAKPSTSQPPKPAPPAPATVSTGQAWIKFIEGLGRNRRSRCDKLAELLKWSNTDNPKVLSDLKASGIDYKIMSSRHTTPNVEFKSTLAKCKRLLTAFPVSKRALMLFRAITDTVTDGKTELMSHVGIFVNLDHANLAFLKRKIEAKKAEADKQEKQKAELMEKQRSKRLTTVISASPASASVASVKSNTRNSKGQFLPTVAKATVAKAGQDLPKLPASITISKIRHNEYVSRTNAGSPGANSTNSDNSVEIKKEPGLLLDRPEDGEGLDDSLYIVNEAKVKKVAQEIERKHLPANRQMRTDVVFDCLHLRVDSVALLAKHGIIYNPKLGKHHLRVLSGQRKSHKNA